MLPVTSHTIAGTTFRCSTWTAGHLQATIADLAKRYPKCSLRIIQPCYSDPIKFPNSAGTHKWDGVFDVEIDGFPWETAQAYLRGQGWAAWHRTPAQGFQDHVHMATIPPGLSGRPTAKQVGEAYVKLGIKVGKYVDGGWTTSSPHAITATCQVADYFAHTFGLASNHQPGADKSWFPSDISTTIHAPTVVKEKPVATTPTVPKVASLYAQITSLANQIIAATTAGTPNSTDAYAIRALSHKHDGSK